MKLYLQLLRDARFAALTGGQMVTLVGDGLFTLIVLFAVVESDASTSESGFFVAATFAVRFTFLAGVVLFSGGLLDRLDPARSAAAADAARVVAYVVMLLLWDGDPSFLIVFLAAVIGSAEAVSEPAVLVIGPRVVERGGARPNEERAGAAIGLLEAMRNVVGIAGPPLGALMLALAGYELAIIVCALAYAFSCIATLWAGQVARQVEQASAADNDDEAEPLARTALTGLGVIWSRPWLRYVQILAVAQVVVSVGPWMVALPLSLTTGSATRSVSAYAAVLAAFSAGTVLGALAGGRIKSRFPGLIGMPALALFGVAALSTGLGASTWIQVSAYVLAGAGTQVFDVLKLRGIRTHVPNEMHGRAYSADFFFSFAAMPLGQLLGAMLLISLSPETVLVAAGVFVLLTGLLPLASRDVRLFGPSEASPRKPGPSKPLDPVTSDQ